MWHEKYSERKKYIVIHTEIFKVGIKIYTAIKFNYDSSGDNHKKQTLV